MGKLEKAFKLFKKAGIYAKVSGKNRLEAYNKISYETTCDEDYCGFVGISIPDNKKRGDNLMIPLIWGVPDRSKKIKIDVYNTICSILTECEIIINPHESLNRTLPEIGVNDIKERYIIVIAENIDSYRDITLNYYLENKVEVLKPQSKNGPGGPCKCKGNEKQQIGRGIRPKFEGRPDRKEPIGDEDIEFLKKLTDNCMDVDTFIKLT